MNWKMQFLLWFVNNVQPIRQVSYDEVNLQRKRNERASALGKLLYDKKQPVKSVEDTVFDGIPVRIYRHSESANQPVMVYFHGGGFVYYSVESHDYVTRRLCAMNRCTVISVDYRLAPEHPFPAAHQDAYAAVRYIHGHAAELRIDPAKIMVAGDSAGANMAACAAHHFKNDPAIRLAAQLLIYPWVDGKIDTPSIEKYKTGYLLTKDAMLWFQEAYTPRKEDQLNPEVSPIYHDDFNGLPPAIVITAEYDPLKDEGYQYADKLKEAGNTVFYKDYKGLVHGFFNMPYLSEEAMQAYRDVQAFVSKILN